LLQRLANDGFAEANSFNRMSLDGRSATVGVAIFKLRND
jgi:hypothetical protein